MLIPEKLVFWLYELGSDKEVSKSNLAHIGNHSHSHEYRLTGRLMQIKKDITKSIDIFEKELGYKSIFFPILLGNTVWNSEVW